MTSFGFKKVLYVLCFALIVCYADACLSYELPDIIVNNNQVANKWVKASYDFDDIVFSQKDVVIKLLSDSLEDPQLKFNESCVDSLKALRKGLLERKLWAYKFLDSSAKGKSGLAYGYVSDLGHYDQCLSINVNEKVGQKMVHFKGQYCLAKLTFPLNKKPEKNFLRSYRLNLSETELKGTLYEYYGNHTEVFFYESFTFALCVPSSCSREEIEQVLHKRMKNSELKAEMKKYCNVEKELCQFLAEKPMDQLIALIALIMCSTFVVMATLWTIFVDGDSPLRHFCALRNTMKLSSEYKDPALIKLRFLDGFKFWYHLGGCYAHWAAFMPVVPLVYATIQDISGDEQKYWWFAVYVKRAIYSTQFIFLVSGFFSSYYMYPIISKAKGNISFVSFAFKRWLRTAPTTVGVFLILFGLSTFFHGPLADELLEKHLGNCRRDWWKTMLYINNWQTFNDICIPQTWSQSVDFQLWLLSYFPLIWLYTNPRRGVISCLAMIGLGIIIPVSVVYYYDLPSHHSGGAIDFIHFILLGEFFPHMHFHTYNNLSNYFIGVLIGYLCVLGIKPKSTRFWYIGQLSAVALFVTATFLPHIWTQFLGFTWTRSMDLVYAGIFRICYAGIFSFYIYGRVSFYKMNPIMENKVITTLGRLAFSVYLAQLLPMAFVISMSYNQINVNKIQMSISSVSVMFLCWILGYIAYLLFEAPFMNLSKAYMNKGSSSVVKANDEIINSDNSNILKLKTT